MRVLGLTMAAAVLIAGCGETAVAPVETAAVVEAPADARPDAAETKPIADVAAMLAGTWQSVDDDRSTLTVTADGVWTGVYADTPPIRAVSAWRVFPGTEKPADVAHPFTPTSYYLEVVGEVGPFYYELGDVTPDFFETFYTARGNRIAWKRVN